MIAAVQDATAPLLEAVGLSRTFPAPGVHSRALTLFRELDLTVRAGEMVAIVGASGTGKSSLLHVLAAMERPTAGSVKINGREITALTPAEAARFRNEEIGYVWQFHYLLPEFSAQENIALPLITRGVPKRTAMGEAAVWMQRIGLADRCEHRSGELSGGEQQRVSIARALVTKPRLLLADEPTGDLDAASAETIFLLLQHLHADAGLSTIMVTHNLEFAARCDRTLRLRDGVLHPA